MDRSLRRQWLWRVVGLLLYLVGLAGALLVAVDVYLASPDRPFASVSTAQLLALAVSLAVSIAGRVIAWTLGGSREDGPGASDPSRDQSPLERLGYHTPGPPADAAEESADEESVVCRECGARNDPAFRYCRECSAELPD